jgi:hypothetical protein
VDRAIFSADFRKRSYAGVALAYAGPIIGWCSNYVVLRKQVW